jgi:hypothetical protein
MDINGSNRIFLMMIYQAMEHTGHLKLENLVSVVVVFLVEVRFYPI